ncbi:hypothetical protein F3Y22_tig00112443pilonHSYRG00103 [Hibiscus syriacus]|uniref:Leucine-rich repeat-containing N-terminal plant-type domain-containing protein n=1 Tax=Hibiscus syriacus TaxID=106335 RepID=A0A6A2XCF0_HIBSY|nr:hypothetical protein F3Y22_tig00112443pilonHSYRG00103 [Hibiscus syriacus]
MHVRFAHLTRIEGIKLRVQWNHRLYGDTNNTPSKYNNKKHISSLPKTTKNTFPKTNAISSPAFAFCVLVSPVDVFDTEHELESLLLLKKNFTNANALNSWMPGSAPCNGRTHWTGLLCYNGGVIGLNLKGMGLSGNIKVEAWPRSRDYVLQCPKWVLEEGLVVEQQVHREHPAFARSSNTNLSGNPFSIIKIQCSSFKGNPGLCGKNLGVECAKLVENSTALKTDPDGLCNWRMKKKKKDTNAAPPAPAQGSSDDPIESSSTVDLVMVNDEKGVFKLADLMKAAAEVLGNGGLGPCYKATVANGVEVVLALLFTWMKFYLLPPYLDFYFHHRDRDSSQVELDWPARLKIVQGIARGLDLHMELSSFEVPHGNLKSSNVLLGPIIIRFSPTTDIAHPYREIPSYLRHDEGGTDVIQWAESALSERRQDELLDPEITDTQNSSLRNMERLLHIGLLCTQTCSGTRLELKTAIKMIEELQVEGVLVVGRHVFPASYKRLHVPCTSQHAGHPRPSDRGHPTEAIRPRPSERAIRGHALRATYPRSVARSVALGCPRIARSDGLGRMASDARMLSDDLGRMASDAQRVGTCMEHAISCRSPGRHGDLVGRPEGMATYGQHCGFHLI